MVTASCGVIERGSAHVNRADSYPGGVKVHPGYFHRINRKFSLAPEPLVLFTVAKSVVAPSVWKPTSSRTCYLSAGLCTVHLLQRDTRGKHCSKSCSNRICAILDGFTAEITVQRARLTFRDVFRVRGEGSLVQRLTPDDERTRLKRIEFLLLAKRIWFGIFFPSTEMRLFGLSSS